MTDVNDFTDYGETCGCGHPHRQHGLNGGCSGTHRTLDIKALPEPEGVDENDPFGWPANWPAVADCPQVERPCLCRSFGPADPEPPEEW